MGWIEDKIQKWARLIDENAEPGTSQKVLEGHQELANLSPVQRAQWSVQAMERLEKYVPDLGDRQEIMLNRSCVFREEFGDEPLQKLHDIYIQKGVDGVLAEMNKNQIWYSKPYREGNTVFVVKNPRDPEGFEKVTDPVERKKAYCHCPLAAATLGMPKPYCYCGGGWYKGIWVAITGESVRIEVITSIMKGGDFCKFAVNLACDVKLS